MPQSVTIASPSHWTLDSIGEQLKQFAIGASAEYASFDDQIQASGPDWSLVVTPVVRAAMAIEDYATNDDLDVAFRETVSSMRLFSIRFSEIASTRRFLSLLAHAAVDQRGAIWIDTDYGWVTSGENYLKQVALNPNWDWRRERDST
jgi:hypothetical protein